MKAVNNFTEAVAAAAASLIMPSGDGADSRPGTKPVAHHQHRLGSFGFELEEYQLGQLTLDDQSTVELALERTQNLLQGSTDSMMNCWRIPPPNSTSGL
ncbi:MAG: hypothetical protein R3F44_17165 [Candidatus Competibacteraceae bacterium]